MEEIKRKPMPARRENVYRLDGHQLPAVTAILSILAKPALIAWAAKTAARAVLEDPETYNTADKAARVPMDARDSAAGRGKAVHAMLEAWGRGTPIDTVAIASEFEPYRAAFKKFLRSWRPTPEHVEVVVANLTHGYAGTTDFIGTIGEDRWLLDFKTGKSIYFEYTLQTAAYRHAEHLWTGNKLEPMPDIDATGVVLLRDDGTFEFQETAGNFDLFLALKNAYVMLREEGQV